MRLSKWNVVGYRSISEASLEVNDEILLIGKNDVGKSNLLDSIFDYSYFFGRVPSRSHIKEAKYDRWWNMHNSNYLDGPIEFSAEYIISDEERERFIADIADAFDLFSPWKENRKQARDFDTIVHTLALDSGGIRNERLWASIGGSQVPVSVRNTAQSQPYRLLYGKIDSEENSGEITNVADLSDISSDRLPEFSKEPNDATGEDDWYVLDESMHGADTVGGVFEPVYRDRLANTTRNWSKVDAIRKPEWTDNRDQAIEENAEGHSSDGNKREDEDTASIHNTGPSSNMEDLVDYLVDIQYEDDEVLDAIEQEYRNVIQTVGGIEIRSSVHDADDRDYTIVVQEGGNQFDFEQISDGAIEAICLVTELHRAGENGGLLLVEEPEVHLHAGSVRRVWQYVETLVEQDNIRLLTATHSTAVIDRSSPDTMLLFGRREETSVDAIQTQDLPDGPIANEKSIGELSQTDIAIFVDGELRTQWVKQKIYQSGIDPAGRGIELFSIDGSYEEELERYETLIQILNSLGIDTRLLAEQWNGERPPGLRGWELRFEESAAEFRIEPFFEKSTCSTFRSVGDGFINSINHEAGTELELSVTTLVETLEDMLSDKEYQLSTEDVVAVLNDQTDAIIRQRHVEKALQELEFQESLSERLIDLLKGYW